MPRQATGTVEEHPWKDGRTVSFYVRVPFKGTRPRISLGTNHEGWSRERAGVELERIMGQIERGTWQPPGASAPTPAAPAEVDDETIHVTLSRLVQRKKNEREAGSLAPNTVESCERSVQRILAFRHETPTAEIDAQWVDELREHLAARKLENGRKGTLAPATVNKDLNHLAQALEIAVDYKILDSNPARGKRRRMPEKKKKGSFLWPDMVVDLLDVAGEWEESLQENKRYGRRALIALLVTSGGPRISEALRADEGEFGLASGDWFIPAAKTEAGERHIELTVFAAEEMREHVARKRSQGRPEGPKAPMFCTRNGTPLSEHNVRRMLRRAVAKTNEKRAAEGKMQLPAITPHSLRRTFATLAIWAKRDLNWIMEQIGHKDPTMTLGIYVQMGSRKQVDRELTWSLMRFADEPEDWPGEARNSPTNRPTGQKVASEGFGSMPAR